MLKAAAHEAIYMHKDDISTYSDKIFLLIIKYMITLFGRIYVGYFIGAHVTLLKVR